MDAVTNPLLDFAVHGGTSAGHAGAASGLPRFTAIRPEHVLPALDRQLADSRALLEECLARGEPGTWTNVAQPLEDMKERLARLWSPVSHLNAVVNSPAMREVYNAGLPKLSEFFTELAQDERVYAAYKTIAASGEYRQLTDAQRRIVDNTLRDFRLTGAELPPAAKARFKEIQMKLSELGNRFSDNVLDATQAWTLHFIDEKDLAGLPESARAMARQSAERLGKPGWLFTLDAPSYIAFMTYADHRDYRRQMYEAFVTRASETGPNSGRFDNGSLMHEILSLNAEAAHLLGFANYAEYALQTRMAKTVDEVLSFLRELAVRAKPAAVRDFDALRKFTREQAGFEPEAWDLMYYSEKLSQRDYRLSQEDLRPYFPETRVVPGLYALIERLYGLVIVRLQGVDVWHPDVGVYEIREPGGEPRGRFYLDLYARANKRGGAWMDDCIGRKRTAASVQLPVAYLTCNFTPPVGGQPALFTHDEVITLFHEFGHGLHHMLTRVDWVGVSGINGVAWDAVELPSQFMENFCWEREVLDLLAAHHETGAPLPASLFERMQAARNFQSGMQCVRQLEFALFDMRLYSDFDLMRSRASAPGSPPSPPGRGSEGEGESREARPARLPLDPKSRFSPTPPLPHQWERVRGEGSGEGMRVREEGGEFGQAIQDLLTEVRQEVAVVIPPDFNRFANSFTHIFAGGYAAGYYSYKWAEVLSADAYERFEEQGIFSPEPGRAFLHDILEQGGVYEPMELFIRFRGRKPRTDALLRHSGLLAA
ncbi:MAG: M3 family metallopeptidase [Pseudomonadota bacterium]